MSTQKLVGENALSAIATDIKTALSTKADSSSIPTKVSDLTNDSDFQTGDEVDAAIATAIANKADIDGEYDLMVVGNAKQLKSNVGENDKVPYLFRTSGGSIDIGDREEDTIVGGTVAFNQLVKNGNFVNTDNWSYSNAAFSVSDNIASFTASAYRGNINNRVSIENGHKLLFMANVKLTTASELIRFGIMIQSGNTWAGYKFTENTTNWQCIGGVCASNAIDINNYVIIRDERSSDFDTIQVKNVMVFDLTAMFGSTVADYIYTLESGTAGAGVAFFRSLFPKPYYAYNAGELISVKTSAHITRGFNAWDEEIELGTISVSNGTNEQNTSGNFWRSKNHIPVIPGQSYYSKMPDGYTTSEANIRLYYYDYNKKYISRADNRGNVVTAIPNDCYFIRFIQYVAVASLTPLNGININLHWDGERDGEYEPYVEHEYPLDSDLELRGIPKLDSNNKLYYDGDTYESDGTVTRRYGIVDLGSLDWQVQGTGTDGGTVFYANSGFTRANNASGMCILPVENTLGWSATKIGTVNLGHTSVLIFSSSGTITDKTAFKNSLNGVYLVYELATPTEETAEPFTNPQLVDDFGTEEYVDNRTVPMPVGHDTFYQANLRAKLEMAPDSPSGNGDYIVRQTDGQNEYVVLTKELPTLPSTDGTYTLKCTVSSGTASLSWVADE